MNAVLPLNERSVELMAEVACALQPYFPDITASWRERITKDVSFDPRALATLERVTIAAACTYFSHKDAQGFFESVSYFGQRLAKLQVDARHVQRAIQLYAEECVPYLSSLFQNRLEQALATLETLVSSSMMHLASAYFSVRSQETSGLLAVLDVELGDMPIEQMLEKVLRITCDAFEASVGVVLLREPETDLLKVAAVLGIEELKQGEYSIPLGQGFAGHIAATGEPEMVLDVHHDTRITSHAFRHKAASVWGMPLRYDGKVIGVLMIGFSQPYAWLPAERDLLRAIADRSALAIRRLHVTNALREREAQIAELSVHQIRVQEDERKRISRELHDETGQALMVIRLYLGMLDAKLKAKVQKDKVAETVSVVDRTIEGLRRIIGKLSPLVLQELGLFAAIRKEAKDLEKNKGIKTRVAISDEVGRLHGETETAIYRIVQESLHNIAKHSQATEVDIEMRRQGDMVHLSVEDNGVGIFPKGNFRGNSFGLAGIKERVGMLDGEVRIISMKGKGTRIEIAVPATEPGDTPREHVPASNVSAGPVEGHYA